MSKYWDNICEMQKKQTEKGIRTYGQTLEENTGMTTEERITYLEEELIDGLMYLEHLRESIKDVHEDTLGILIKTMKDADAEMLKVEVKGLAVILCDNQKATEKMMDAYDAYAVEYNINDSRRSN